MTHASLEERAAQADRVAAMAGMVERLLAGEATRPEVQAWAAAARRAGGPLAGNPVGDDLDACLDALDVDQAGHPLLDDADLRDHLDALRRGAPACRSRWMMATSAMSGLPNNPLVSNPAVRHGPAIAVPITPTARLRRSALNASPDRARSGSSSAARSPPFPHRTPSHDPAFPERPPD